MSALLSLLFATSGVTISFFPTPLPQALELLSPQLGTKLTAAPALQDEVLLANLVAAEPDKVLQHIAESLQAKWIIQRDGSKALVRDPQAVAKRAQEFEAAAQATVAESFAYLTRTLSKQPDNLDQAFITRYKQRLKQEEERRNAARNAQDIPRMLVNSSAEEESPVWRAGARLVLLLAARAIADLPNEARVVYSSKPTPMQKGLPSGAQSILRQYEKELELLHLPLTPAKYRLSIKRWEVGGGSNAELEVLDAAGDKIDNALIRLNGDSDQLKIPFDQRLAPITDTRKVELPAETLQCLLAMKRDRREASDAARIAWMKWRPQLLTPEKVEPTRHFQGAELVCAARVMGKNLIGTVWDLTDSTMRRDPENLTVGSILSSRKSLFYETEDGWLVARPEEPLARASREAAGRLIRNSVKAGGISVDAAAAWVGQSSDKWPLLGWPGDHLRLLLSGTGPYSALSTILDSEPLRMWWLLGETRRASLRRGDTFLIRELPPELRSQLAKSVYWLQEVEGEPTEVLPNGISDGTLQLTIHEKPVFSGWSSQDGEPDQLSPIDAAAFGTYLVKGNTWWQRPAELYRNMDRFRLGIHRAYELKFTFLPDNVPLTVQLSETFFDPAQKPVKELPKQVQTDIEAAKKAAGG